MAQRRMMSLKIIDTDLFLEMPISARLLYYDLCMRADDDGFVSSPKKIQKMTGCSEDDLKLLMAKQFIIPFETGICVIKHWKIHNYIRTDRYQETEYKQEKQMLETVDNTYSLTNVIPNVNQMSYQMDTQVRLGKDSIGKDNNIHKKFQKPTIEEIKEYCEKRNNNVDAETFFDFYESKGWKIGNQSMKDWKASVRTWERNRNTNKNTQTNKNLKHKNYEQRNYDNLDEFYDNL